MSDANFIQATHFQVEFDIVPFSDTTAGGWCGFKFLDSTGTPQFANGGDGFGLLIDQNGGGSPFDGGSSLAGYPAGTFLPTSSNHVAIEVVTGAFDGSKSGKTTLVLNVNGTLVSTYIIAHNFLGNYISMYYALSAAETANLTLFDNLKLVTAPSAYANLTSVTTGVGVNSTPITVFAPISALAKGDVDVVVTSSSPSVATPSGATGASLTLHFAKGGPNTKTFTALGKSVGQCAFSLTSPQVATAGSVNVSVGFLAHSVVANPSFMNGPPALWPSPGDCFIDRWTPNTASTGLNGNWTTSLVVNDFADNGLVPDRNMVAFIDNDGSFEQNISGLAVGAPHWLQFRYNVSANSYVGGLPVGAHKLIVSYNGKVIGGVTNAQPVETFYSYTQPWYFLNLPFVPDAASGSLKFEHTVTDSANSPATMLLDAVSVVMRGADEVAVENPSFEASGYVTAGTHVFEDDINISGWTVDPANGWGVNKSDGPFWDNGMNADQDLVLFVQGGGKSISQTIQGLKAGASYQLSFAYNARTGVTPHLEVSMDTTVLMSSDIQPVGGTNQFYRANLAFTATTASMVLKFANTATGDTTFLLDDVHIASQAPSLTVRAVAPSSVQLAWPASVSGYVLQSSTSLTSGWSSAGLTPTVQGNQSVVTDSVLSGTTKFYRLAR